MPTVNLKIHHGGQDGAAAEPANSAKNSVIKEELIPAIREVATLEEFPVIDLYAALEGKKKCFPDKLHPNKATSTKQKANPSQ